MDRTGDLGQDREGVRIPFQQDVVGLHLFAVAVQDLGAVHNLVTLFFASLVVNQGQNAVAVHGDQFAFGVLHGVDRDELHKAV